MTPEMVFECIRQEMLRGSYVIIRIDGWWSVLLNPFPPQCVYKLITSLPEIGGSVDIMVLRKEE